MYTHQAVKLKIANRLAQLRKDKHDAGFPFMVTDAEALPQNYAYMEYPDGTVEIVEFSADYKDYRPVRILADQELTEFRERYRLSL